MKIRVTHPIRDGETLLQAGEIAEVPNAKAQEWLVKEWCTEIQEVKHEPKPAKKH